MRTRCCRDRKGGPALLHRHADGVHHVSHAGKDGRFEARKVEVWNDYLSVSRGHANWQKTLDRYGVKTLVLNKEFHDDLIPLVAQDATWRKVYEDKAGIVYTR